MRLTAFDEWARAHHGLITWGESGLTKRAWHRAIEAGSLVGIHPYVARLPGTPVTPEQRIAAAVLAIPWVVDEHGTIVDGALASHRSSALLWGIPRPDDDPVDLLTPWVRHDNEFEDVIIHRSGDRAHLFPPQIRYGIRCTGILRTLVDLGAVDPSGVRDGLGVVLAREMLTLPTAEAVLADHARSGRPGIAALREAVDAWAVDAKPADSVLEPAMRRLVDRYRLPPVEFHPRVLGWEVDFRVVGTPVILECDGWAFHGLDRERFERDRERDAQLVAAGWIVVRFTYRSIMNRPGQTAKRILEAVERWADAPAPDAA